MATSAGFAVAPAIYAKLPCDPVRDFAHFGRFIAGEIAKWGQAAKNARIAPQ
jgi:hypothetical protein